MLCGEKILKDKFTLKLSAIIYSSQVTFHGQRNICGASRQNGAAAFSFASEVDGDLILNWEKTPKKRQHSTSGVIKVSRSPKIQNRFEKKLFTSIFKLKSSLAAELKASACTPSEAGDQAQPHVQVVNNVFFESVRDLGATAVLDHTRWAVRSHFMSFSGCFS